LLDQKLALIRSDAEEATTKTPKRKAERKETKNDGQEKKKMRVNYCAEKNITIFTGADGVLDIVEGKPSREDAKNLDVSMAQFTKADTSGEALVEDDIICLSSDVVVEKSRVYHLKSARKEVKVEFSAENVESSDSNDAESEVFVDDLL
jgi:hypothetical protein